MNAMQHCQLTAELSSYVLDSYMADLSDADLMRRPGPGCTHLAYQLGHLISSQCDMLNALAPGSAPTLPAGFKEKHSKPNAENDDPAAFLKKDEYVTLLVKCREAAKTELAKVTEADFDKPAPESMRAFFPTVGHIWALIATHPMMHAGQFVPVRRALGKPIVM
jgi:hypothetical protein